MPDVPSATSDPRTYDYSSAARKCDIVMKGGITSGVVYPHAVCELARTYRFVNIGGTSAGAIAAAGAAAAEYGRDTGGFAKLAELPKWVGEGTHLFDLFQPQPSTRRLFQTFTAGLGLEGSARYRRIASAAARRFPLALLLGAAPGIALVVLSLLAGGSAWLRVLAVVAGVLLAVIGAILGLLARIVLLAPKTISKNGFGLCSGMPTTPTGGPPALTPWLSELIDHLAGKTDGTPLTIRDLRFKEIELAMMTTNVTQRRPHRLPWTDRVFFFDPDEWRGLFPDYVVQWMVEHPAALDDDESEVSERIRKAMLPRVPFPAPDDLPVVVAARMSLSFPLLISAVPLWSFDRTLKSTNDALSANPPAGAHAVPERCWFSDGGISSNFPVHFFDAPFPTRPTFAIDLDEFHPDHPKSLDEAENVWLPDKNVGGILETWHRFPEKAGPGQLMSFAMGIVRTMQNRVDTALARQPGYRDRIVHVHADGKEGGMNLSMPPPVITALTRRGQEAAKLLTKRFADTPGTTPGLSWDNHRWVRYRSSMACLAELLKQLSTGWTDNPPGERTYEQLARRADNEGPAGYRFPRVATRDLTLDVTGRLADASEAITASGQDLSEGAPRPQPVARIVPRD